MWSDKETTEDLLGYSVHASLLKSVVMNEKNLPITVGLYGDWGLGKTSILKILEQELKKDSDTVFQFVPMQDFSEAWTDEKLYAKYGITKPEQKFIESMIKPME